MNTLFLEIDYLIGSQLSLLAHLLSEAGVSEKVEYQFKDKGLHVIFHDNFECDEYSKRVLDGMKTMKIIEKWTFLKDSNPLPSEQP